MVRQAHHERSVETAYRERSTKTARPEPVEGRAGDLRVDLSGQNHQIPLTNFACSPRVKSGIRPGVPAGMPGYLFGVDAETARYAKIALDRMLAAV